MKFRDAFASAKGEAERAFGDGALLVERYIEGARHVEVQIFGDHQGDVMHLYERDCSVQRRHQKIIEESPSPAVTPEIQSRMTDAAMALARKVGYTNAGTVEFLLAPSGDFYFIEVNTRIQVEHPVTEMVTGLNLIGFRLRLRKAANCQQRSRNKLATRLKPGFMLKIPRTAFCPQPGRCMCGDRLSHLQGCASTAEWKREARSAYITIRCWPR